MLRPIAEVEKSEGQPSTQVCLSLAVTCERGEGLNCCRAVRGGAAGQQWRAVVELLVNLVAAVWGPENE
jgi:hypothetical protein